MKKTYEYSLKAAQQQAFLEVFNLHAKNGKITKRGLMDIFDRIGYEISDQNFDNIVEKTFGHRD
jgi:Ca2+-binding EF-hand superfamily protein